MSSAQANPTLLVFTLGPEGDVRHRPLLPSGHRDAELELRRACFAAVLEVGRGAGCRVVVSSPSPPDVDGDGDGVDRWLPQRGHGFGARLLDALGGVEAASPGPTVLVGTDVPGLARAHVESALRSLDADPDRVVLGPSPDGGFYLLAAARPVAHLLRGVRWCRRDTLRRVIRALARGGRRVVLLSPLRDLDRRGDLERWLASPGASRLDRRLVRRLRQLLAALRLPPDFAFPTLRPSLLPTGGVRGPPALRG
jgi:hypothetical protein